MAPFCKFIYETTLVHLHYVKANLGISSIPQNVILWQQTILTWHGIRPHNIISHQNTC